MAPPFQLQFIDHVAIRSVDPQATREWYEQTLGLEFWQPPEWKPFPFFLMHQNFGIAVFPIQDPATPLHPHTRHFITIDHFAFRVSMEHLLAAQQHFDDHNTPYDFQDHTYFHSIYLKDPDGHTVELTAPLAVVS